MSEAKVRGAELGPLVRPPGRPYIIGLNNPQSADPRHALYPHDTQSAGYRLWRLVDDVHSTDCANWLTRTQRVNLLSDLVLPRDYRSAARRRGNFLHALICDRVVVMLGSDVAAAMLHEAEPFVWSGSWVTIPHPSGRNRAYNDPVVRAAAGLLLADILRYCGGER